MMMPVFPGAPWVPKFSGAGGDLSYGDWKEQIQGLLEAQEMTEAKKVKILLGALGGDAKREMSVLADEERDKLSKIFDQLDILHVGEVPVPVLRSQFFSCRQKSDESFKGFVLRLRELFRRLQRRSPEGALVEDQLKEQLLMGMEDGPMLRALKTYARRNPAGTFAELHQEALLLEVEYGQVRYETACAAISQRDASNPRTYRPDWRAELKREILEEVKGQIRELTQEVMRELRPSNSAAPVSLAPPQQQALLAPRRKEPQSINRWDPEGRPICRSCQQPGHVARNCRENGEPRQDLNENALL